MKDIATDLILDEFNKLKLHPLSVLHKDLTHNIDNFYCRIFIKDNIYVIARMTKLRNNIKLTLGDNYDLCWNISNRNNEIMEITILKKESLILNL